MPKKTKKPADGGSGVDLLDKDDIKSKNVPPKKYKIIFHNDDFTPMDFVVKLLIEIFYHDSDTAEELTKLIHDKGKGVAGTYSYEIAEQKSIESTSMARTAGHPLQVTIEKE